MNLKSEQKRIAFGYDRAANGEIIINEGQAATVRLIYSYYLDGKSLADIKVILESISIPSPQNKPRWGKQTLSNILSNYHYLGTENYPAIIFKTEFDKVQEIKINK
ncbi:MAG TPA: hypothetical protein GXX64_10915 [Bacteroidales bacterium]|jgi:hypothetical protein|nr:hypothetical protein [Bacteroidales bacterium]